MNRFLTILLLAIAFTLPAVAQAGSDAPATTEDVEAYMQVMHSHDLVHKMMDSISKPMHQMVHDEYMKNKEKLPPDFEARMTRNIDEMFNTMPWDDILAKMAGVYQKHFTKGDIQALTAFYSGPTGQKVLHEMPAIMAEAMQSMMPMMQAHVETVNTRVQKEMTEMVAQYKSAAEETKPDAK